MWWVVVVVVATIGEQEHVLKVEDLLDVERVEVWWRWRRRWWRCVRMRHLLSEGWGDGRSSSSGIHCEYLSWALIQWAEWWHLRVRLRIWFDAVDGVNGASRCHEGFGGKAQRRWRQWALDVVGATRRRGWWWWRWRRRRRWWRWRRFSVAIILLMMMVFVVVVVMLMLMRVLCECWRVACCVDGGGVGRGWRRRRGRRGGRRRAEWAHLGCERARFNLYVHADLYMYIAAAFTIF